MQENKVFPVFCKKSGICHIRIYYPRRFVKPYSGKNPAFGLFILCIL